MDKTKILIVSCIEWDDRNAFGNTISNFFDTWDDVEYASIYTRSSLPSNNICKRYYRVTIKDILKNLFSRKQIGQELRLDGELYHGRSSERNLINRIKRSKMYGIISYIIDTFYLSKLWINSKYKRFIHDFAPDIVFLFGKGDSFLINNAEYIKKHIGAKVVTFVADDVLYDYNGLGILNKRRRLNLSRLINISDKLYGASDELSRKYSKLYNTHFTTHYKGCHFMPMVTKTHNPCEIVYAGNLYYGRVDVLIKLAQAIKTINAVYPNKYHLSIYSSTDITPEQRVELDVPHVSKLNPSVSYSEVMTLMNEASIVLHVESFLPSEMEKVKFSFSTKIIDCLQSGSVPMVIGPEEQSSVRYLKHIPGVIVINNIADIGQTLDMNLNSLLSQALKVREYSILHHDINVTRQSFKEDLINLIK